MMKKQKLVTLATAAMIAGVAATATSIDSVKADTKPSTDSSAKTTSEATTQDKSAVSGAQKSVATAQAAKNAAQSTANSTAASKSAAKTQLVKASSSADAASSAQSAAEQYKSEATSEGITKAQVAVSSAKSETSAAQQAVSVAQTPVSAAKADVAAKSSAASSAQSAVNTINSQISKIEAKTSTEKASITLAKSYINAYKKYLSDITNDTARDNLDTAVKSFDKTAKITDYKATTADKNEKITNVGKLTTAQAKELTTFTAGVINALRAQVGTEAVKVSDGSVKLIQLEVAQEEKEKYNAGKEGDTAEMNSSVWNDADLTSAGIKSTAVKDYFGKYKSYVDDWDYPLWTFYSTKNLTMADLKEAAFEAVQYALQASDYVRGDLLGSKASADVKGEYLGATFDNYGTLHLNFIINFDAAKVAAAASGNDFGGGGTGGYGTEIPASSKFFDNQTTPVLKSTSSSLSAADTATLKKDKANLVVAQKKVTTANAALKSAKAILSAVQAKVNAANKVLTTAKQTQKTAEQYLSNLGNADANLATAKQAVIDAQTNLVAAKAAYAKTIAPDQVAQEALKVAKAVLTTAETKLSVAKANLAKRQNAAAQKTLVLKKSGSNSNVQQVVWYDHGVSNRQTQKLASNNQSKSQALPQTDDANQSYLVLIGMALLSLIGLGTLDKKRRI
ncbi:hypothetical protein A7K95_08030 [Pediococcus parvulus]|uniref:Gram-positive cocci surface proteins LPxTG domain-containing protein n=1 Tax=Pediococcus parvulus TaxID=54062 RepID=A0ABX2UFY4_9LACO|nr:SEC10/PgrA surface exclusion domain-containing protein [Pediococcus parvulus]OAD63803.1 hypothetical protein A7K95_08030 [Pediococcus parvulus]